MTIFNEAVDKLLFYQAVERRWTFETICAKTHLSFTINSVINSYT